MKPVSQVVKNVLQILIVQHVIMDIACVITCAILTVSFLVKIAKMGNHQYANLVT